MLPWSSVVDGAGRRIGVRRRRRRQRRERFLCGRGSCTRIFHPTLGGKIRLSISSRSIPIQNRTAVVVVVVVVVVVPSHFFRTSVLDWNSTRTTAHVDSVHLPPLFPYS